MALVQPLKKRHLRKLKGSMSAISKRLAPESHRFRLRFQNAAQALSIPSIRPCDLKSQQRLGIATGNHSAEGVLQTNVLEFSQQAGPWTMLADTTILSRLWNPRKRITDAAMVASAGGRGGSGRWQRPPRRHLPEAIVPASTRGLGAAPLPEIAR